MNPVAVDSLIFNFHATVKAEKYDDWNHVNSHWINRNGMKKMDVVAVEPIPAVQTLWMIEAKDFRIITSPPRSSNIAGLPQTVADKAAHTIQGLSDTAINATDANEKNLALQSQKCNQMRIVLHLEPHPPTGGRSALFPANFAVNVYQRIRQLVAHIDPNPLVLNISNTPRSGVPWSVA